MLTFEDRLEMVVKLAASMVTGTGHQPVNTSAVAEKAWRLLESIEDYSEDRSVKTFKPVAKPVEVEKKPLVYASSGAQSRVHYR